MLPTHIELTLQVVVLAHIQKTVHCMVNVLYNYNYTFQNRRLSYRYMP